MTTTHETRRSWQARKFQAGPRPRWHGPDEVWIITDQRGNFKFRGVMDGVWFHTKEAAKRFIEENAR